MPQLISNELCSACCEQIGKEKFNSNLYLFMGGLLRNKGFNNLASYFAEDQHEEEFKHSKMIFDLLTDLNSPITIPEINEVNIQFDTIIDIANKFVQAEIETTDSLDEIKHMAIDEGNPVVEEFFRGMITLQRKEYEESIDFLDKATLTGGDWFKVMLWDLSLNK